MRELTYRRGRPRRPSPRRCGADPKIFYMSTDALAAALEGIWRPAGSGRRADHRGRRLPGWRSARPGCGFRPIADWAAGDVSALSRWTRSSNQAAKIHYMFGGPGAVSDPLFGASVGGRRPSFAAQHSQSPYSMFMNVAGLKMFLPSTPLRP